MKFIIAPLLLNHINIQFQSTSVWLKGSKSLSKNEGYKYINLIFRGVISFKITTFKLIACGLLYLQANIYIYFFIF